ncbi:hypothetical protein FB451DRAFT_1259032 [Mycena latifolia]|nr:hypothetical protein FB451DRAFT_1259032 [Mycena latifolia]
MRRTTLRSTCRGPMRPLPIPAFALLLTPPRCSSVDTRPLLCKRDASVSSTRAELDKSALSADPRPHAAHVPIRVHRLLLPTVFSSSPYSCGACGRCARSESYIPRAYLQARRLSFSRSPVRAASTTGGTSAAAYTARCATTTRHASCARARAEQRCRPPQPRVRVLSRYPATPKRHIRPGRARSRVG